MGRLTVYNEDTDTFELVNAATPIETIIETLGEYEYREYSLSFGAMLKRARKVMGLSQLDVAGKLKVSQSLIHLFEKEERRPNHETIVFLAEYLHISYDQLMSAYRITFYRKPDVDNIGSLIKAERKISGMSLESLAKKMLCSIRIGRLRRFEAGTNIPYWYELKLIAKALQSDALLKEANESRTAFENR